MAYEETRQFAYYYDKPAAVEDYGKVMNHLRHLALNPKQSRALIAKVRKELQRSPTGANPPTVPTTPPASKRQHPHPRRLPRLQAVHRPRCRPPTLLFPHPAARTFLAKIK